MLIQELIHLESVSNSNAVHGSTGRRPRGFDQVHNLNTNFVTTNYFQTIIKPPNDVYNYSAAAGAKADAVVHPYYGAYGSYTKADTLSFVDFLGNSTSYSASAALITP